MEKKKLKLISGSKERAEEVEEVLKSWGAEFCYMRGGREDLFYYVDGNTEKIIGKDSDILKYLDYEVIELPEKPKRWRDDNTAHLSGWYLKACPGNIERDVHLPNIRRNRQIFATEKQAKSALAMAQISQIMENDERFGGVVTDEEWNNYIERFCIVRLRDNILPVYTHCEYKFLAFHTREQRDLFLAENEDLVKDYFML